MKKKFIIILTLIIIFLISYISFNYKYYYGNSQKNHKYYGNIDTRTVKVGFRFIGKIENITKDEGESVKKDEILVILDNQNLKKSLIEIEANINASNIELSKLKSGYRYEEIQEAKASFEEANANLNKANDTYTRQKNLYKTKSTSEENFTLSELNYKQAHAALDKAKAAYELMKNGYRNEDIKIQEEKIKALEAQKEKLEIDIKDSIITSPVNGVILTRYKEIGSIATAGEAILEIAKNDEFWVRAYIDEKSLGEIKPGLKMKVFSDSRKEPYEGYIGFISSVAEFTPKNIETEELRADLVYSFRVIVKNIDDKLRQGMPVTLEIAENNANN
jgi:HlyD family secretion protein